MGHHDTAQVCLTGHVITENYHRSPSLRQDFCKQCGAKTITQCQSCKAEILGDYHVEGVFVIGAGEPDPPKHCHKCGKPYPWARRRRWPLFWSRQPQLAVEPSGEGPASRWDRMVLWLKNHPIGNPLLLLVGAGLTWLGFRQRHQADLGHRRPRLIPVATWLSPASSPPT